MPTRGARPSLRRRGSLPSVAARGVAAQHLCGDLCDDRCPLLPVRGQEGALRARARPLLRPGRAILAHPLPARADQPHARRGGAQKPDEPGRSTVRRNLGRIVTLSPNDTPRTARTSSARRGRNLRAPSSSAVLGPTKPCPPALTFHQREHAMFSVQLPCVYCTRAVDIAHPPRHSPMASPMHPRSLLVT